MNIPTTPIPGLSSPSATTLGLVYFARMIDKIRLDMAGLLPADWQANLGTPDSFDGRCCRFLHIDYQDLDAETRNTQKSPEQLLQWAFSHGRHPSEEEIEIWNDFMLKRAWRDELTPRLHFRLAEKNLPPDTVLTMFEYIDLDEGRLQLPQNS